METLTEPGVLPIPHHPISPCGFYQKQDTAPYYFSSSSPTRPDYRAYQGYHPQASEGDSWTNSENGRHHPYQRYQSREDDSRLEEKTEEAMTHNSSTNSQSSPQYYNPSYHHKSQLYKSSSSLIPYSHDHHSPSSKEKDQNKHCEDSNNSSEVFIKQKKNTFIANKLKIGIHSSVEYGDFSRPDPVSLRSENVHASHYTYNKHIIHERYMNDNHKVMYHQQDVIDTPQSVKNIYSNESTGFMSFRHQPSSQSLVSDDEQEEADVNDNELTSTEFRDKLSSSKLSKIPVSRALPTEPHMDKEKKQEPTSTPEHPKYRRDLEYPIHMIESKLTDGYSMKDRNCRSVTNSHLVQERRTEVTAEEYASFLKRKQGNSDNMLPSAHISTVAASPESCHRDSADQQYRHVSSQIQCHTSYNNLRSPTKLSVDCNDQLPTTITVDCNLQSPNISDSRLHVYTQGKPATSPSHFQHRFNGETPPSSSWTPQSPSPLLQHLKQPQKETFSEDHQEVAQNKNNNKTTTYIESSKLEDCIPTQKIMTINNISLSETVLPQQLSREIESPSKTPSKSPSRRLSQEGYPKINRNDSYEDVSLDAKREIFSDDGEDDSACEESISHSPTFSPYHDASIPYPHHFPHHFFPTHGHGPLSGLKFPFGSLQGPHDRSMPGAGFPFGSMPQDMALMGHMHQRSPFAGSASTAIGQARLMTGEKDIFYCHLCNYSGKSKSEFDNHMNTHFEFNCPHCDYTSRTEGRLKRHIKDFHSEDSARRSMPGRPKVYKCKQCPFSATEKDTFWTHSRTHIKEDKLLQCPKCSFVTEYKHHLEYHLRNHFGSKPFKCPKCNYSCVNKSMLNSHMKSHTNVYQYRCSECTYATKYCHSLKLHLKKYNHKPATVLNQDGSLPQGLDVESSGLSIVSKRGPPRGPRGTRKDNAYMNHLFEMPQMQLGVPGMNPMINGMMPFWPMLQQTGIPSLQPGMLPGIRNIAQHRSIMVDHRGSTDDSKLDDTMGEISQSSSEESKSNEDRICRLCNFIAESREALGLHLMQAHKEEAKEVVISYGFSETFLVESFKKVNADTKFEHQQMSEPAKEIENNQQSTEIFHRKSNSCFLYNKNVDLLHIKTDREELSKTPPSSWPPSSSYSESKPQEICYSLISNNAKNDNNSNGSNSEIDILQQMTLKFGTSLPLSMRPYVREEDEQEDNLQDSKSDNIQRFHQIPLDLTKPKSVSPPIFRNSPTQENVDHQVNDVEHNRSNSADGTKFKSSGYEIQLKRKINETDDGNKTTSISFSETSTVAPRKRSRKGKAYKLNTLCLKLQNKQVGTTLDDDDVDDEHDFNIENNSLQFQHLPVIEYGKKKTIDKVDIDQMDIRKADNDHSLKTNDINNCHASQTEINLEQNDEVMITGTDNEMRKVTENIDFSNKELKKDSSINEALDKDEKSSDISNEQSGVIKRNKRFVQDEAEFELQKLQRNLKFLNPLLNSSNLESANEGVVDKGKQLENKYSENEGKYDDQIDDNSSEATVEEETCLDKEGNESASLTSKSSQKYLEGEDVEQVEMINTVLENRKKPVTPAVRRGTELAWKLLNDPINPVTTIPLPVDALPSSQYSKKSPVPQSDTPILQEFVNITNSAVMRKDMKPHTPLLEYSHHQSSVPQLPSSHTRYSPAQQLHQTHPTQLLPSPSQQLHQTPPYPSSAHHLNQTPTAQSHHSHTQHHHPLNTPQSHHPHTPHHPHIPQSLMSMKSLMSMPIPSTPMAYIPPTNRLLSDQTTGSPNSRVKPSLKELYDCTYCDLSFRDCVMYTVHMGYHSNQNPFQCNSCGAVSRDKVEFFLHIARSPHA